MGRKSGDHGNQRQGRDDHCDLNGLLFGPREVPCRDLLELVAGARVAGNVGFEAALAFELLTDVDDLPAFLLASSSEPARVEESRSLWPSAETRAGL